MADMSTQRQSRIQATQRFKVMACRECGQPMQVGSNTRYAPKCVNCKVVSAEKAIREMAIGEGETYDKWRNAMLRKLGLPTMGGEGGSN